MNLREIIESREPHYPTHYPVAIFEEKEERWMNWWGVTRSRKVIDRRTVIRARP